ncbi:MAG: arginine--tRNA ligase, partial [Myxococcales bacterium]|nr:arginine--tRNA ligase [Myxococcales bacterium]
SGDVDKSVGDLGAFYRAARAKFDKDPAFADRARARVVSLQAGDAATLDLWRRIVEVSHQHFDSVYARLGVTITRADAAGESLFNPMLASVVAELEEKGLTAVDQGALCVFPPGFKGKDGNPFPLIVRKSDGGYGYAATDLAAIKYRFQTLGAKRAIYVVGSPQAQHLSMIYKVAEMAGWLAPPLSAVHVGFGSVLGEDGKILKSRAGEALSLLDLLNEADERALATVREKNAERRDDPVTAADEAKVAHAIGMAAIKYADLSSDRVKDYVFAWDRMLADKGNTGPYLQYAHARTRSIIRKSGEPAEAVASGTITVGTKEERDLALGLLSFPRVVRDVGETLEPHRLCGYLFDLASTFSSFFTACPVLKAEPAERASRLALCDLTARVMKQGLGLLGIEAPERM